MSDYLADPNSFPFFEYDPATKILSVANIVASAVAANTAFINNLQVKTLNTIPGANKRNIKIAEDTLLINDGNSNARVVMWSKPLPALSELIGPTSGLNTYIDHKPFDPTTGTHTISPGFVVNGNLANNVTISGKCNVSARLGFGEISSAIEMTLNLANATDGTVIYLGQAEAQSGGITDQPFGDLAFKLNQSLSAGTWNLQAVVWVQYGNQCHASISLTTINVEYLTDGVTYVGINGIASAWNSNKYFYMAHTNDSSAPFIKTAGLIDMPGVLAKARVGSNGAISKQWGAYKITAVQNITSGDANKKVHHTFAKDSYTAIVTPIGKNVVANVIQEYASYVEIYSTGAFNIILTGNN